MTRCWNCGLPDVAERCQRCGAPQEQARRGAPPPASPPGGFQPPPGFIINGAPADHRPSGGPSGPMFPPGHPSGPLPPSGPQSGQFRPAGFPSGPLPSRGNPSGPLPPAGGYPPRGPAPGGRSHPNAGPPGWDEPEMPPAPRRSASMPLPSRSGPLPFEDERLPPEYQRGAPPPRSGGRPPTRPTPPPQAPRGWEDAGAAPVPEFRQQSGDFRAGNRRDEVAPKQIERRAEPVWDDDERWSLNRDPDALTLSAMTNAILGGAIGGVLGGALWVGAVVVTGLSMPYLAVVVGLLAGVGARMDLEQTRPWIIGAFGALGAALAFLVTQYALFDYGLIHQGLATGLFALSPLRFPQVYIDYVTGVSDDVTHSLGFSGEHPLDMGVLLACMTVCWLVLVRRKR